VPEEHIGKPSLMITACYSGRLEDGGRHITPLTELAKPFFSFSEPLEFLKLQDISRTFGVEDSGASRHYWKSIFVDELRPELFDILRSSTLGRPSDQSSITLYTLGGMFARIGPEESAFDNRDQQYLVAIEADWTEPKDDVANIRWARGTYDAINEHYQARIYLNFPGFAEEKDIVEGSFGGNMMRLREIKAKYDPENIFRGHLPIGPRSMTPPARQASPR
jgi:hypothetical protein